MISIVMPTHKQAPYLWNTIMSVVCQLYTDYEFIVVDASKDKYFKWYLDSISANSDADFSKIKVYEPDKDCDKPGAMKMYGYEHTSCDSDDYIIFLDHDDFLIHDTLRLVSESTKTYKPDMISGEYVSTYMADSHIYNNIVSYMNGVYLGKTIDKLWFGKTYMSFNNGLHVYENNHDFISNVHPGIYKKSVFESNRMFFVDDTFTMDDITKGLFCPFLSEVYIKKPLYCYCAYKKGNNSTQGRMISQYAVELARLKDELHRQLVKSHFKKDRKIYVP